MKILKRIHGSTQHYGKSPKKIVKIVKAKNEFDALKEKLQKAIQKEDFEEAAKLRDKIRELEKKNNK